MADDFLIRELRLLTATPLSRMREFYRDKIGFRVLAESASEISFAGGGTRLTFMKAGPEQIKGAGNRGNGEPFYHFAFNIPRDKILAARSWQLERTRLTRPRPGLLDPAYPDDVWHFSQWNAHSVFFFDPAFNIVEYIARHNLDTGPGHATRATPVDGASASGPASAYEPASSSRHESTPKRISPAEQKVNPERTSRPARAGSAGEGRVDSSTGRDAFSVADILCASEIGYVMEQRHQPKATQMLRKRLGIQEYPRGSDPWAMGDERGLLLCLARLGEMWGDDPAEMVKWDVYPTEAIVRGSKPGVQEFADFPYRVRVE